jgi:hypothetical protein
MDTPGGPGKDLSLSEAVAALREVLLRDGDRLRLGARRNRRAGR